MPPVMLFDGKCFFCNSVVYFILRHEWAPQLAFGALQSVGGRRLLGPAPPQTLDSFVIVDEQGVAHTHFEAVKHMFRLMGGPWRYLGVFVGLFVPAFIGNACYNLGWRYRYRLLGESDKCLAPKPELRARLIEGGNDYDE